MTGRQRSSPDTSSKLAKKRPTQRTSRKTPEAALLRGGPSQVIALPDDWEGSPPLLVKAVEPLQAKTPAQKTYLSAIAAQRLIIATGPAGTGKTFLCAAQAGQMLKDRKIERIVVTRPAVEAGESLGFLPGELDEKFAPYLMPLREVLVERLGKGFVDYCIGKGKIEALPLAYMRGRTFKNSFVILDEAQNTTPLQMKMFLTRMGQGSTVVVNGDPTQKDIHGPSGLEDAVNKVRGLPGVALVEFTRADVVRSDLVQLIIDRYAV
jgi:phosphate starvation-inducible protein PhoH and related proteins